MSNCRRQLRSEMPAGRPWGPARRLTAALLTVIAGIAVAVRAEEPCSECTALESRSALDDADIGLWRTERLHEAVQAQLKRLGSLLKHPDAIDRAQLATLADADCLVSPLRPPNLTVVFDDPAFTVLRARSTSGVSAAWMHHGEDGFRTSLEGLVQPFIGARELRTKFKVFRVLEDPATDRLATSVYFHLSGVTAAGRSEINATWRCAWTRPDAVGQPSPPKLAELRVVDYEQIAAAADQSDPLLCDCTGSMLAGKDAPREQIRRGVNQWMDQLDYRAGVDLQGHQGLAVGDLNGDGLEDVYLCQNGALPNLLLLQNADGTVSEQAAEAQLDLLPGCRGVLLLDLDNDDDQDVVLSTDKEVLFLENDGQTRFTLRAAWQSAARLFSLAAADYDNDGDLDIYACGLVELGERPLPVPYHDANNGGRNTLLNNEGKWQFRDVTAAVGLEHNNSRFSYAAAWEDYDNDGDPDLYVANDFGRNNLYRNDLSEGGKFVDVAGTAGAEDIGAGMSAAWGDYNSDGQMDLYVSNMFSSAGGRIAFQARFGGAYDDHEKSQLRRHARGNTLLAGQTNGAFADVSLPAHVTVGRWAWASSFADLNNDGLEDLLVANGYITGDDTKDL